MKSACKTTTELCKCAVCSVQFHFDLLKGKNWYLVWSLSFLLPLEVLAILFGEGSREFLQFTTRLQLVLTQPTMSNLLLWTRQFTVVLVFLLWAILLALAGNNAEILFRTELVRVRVALLWRGSIRTELLVLQLCLSRRVCLHPIHQTWKVVVLRNLRQQGRRQLAQQYVPALLQTWAPRDTSTTCSTVCCSAVTTSARFRRRCFEPLPFFSPTWFEVHNIIVRKRMHGGPHSTLLRRGGSTSSHRDGEATPRERGKLVRMVAPAQCIHIRTKGHAS